MTMEIKFALTAMADVMDSLSLVANMLEADFIEDKTDYGEGPSKIYFGLKCTSRDIVEAGFFPSKKPRFIKLQKLKMLDGSFMQFENVLSWEVRLNYEFIHGANALKIKAYVLNCILEEIECLKRFKKFEFTMFKAKIELLKNQTQHPR
jgi:hypothetical protein